MLFVTLAGAPPAAITGFGVRYDADGATSFPKCTTGR